MKREREREREREIKSKREVFQLFVSNELKLPKAQYKIQNFQKIQFLFKIFCYLYGGYLRAHKTN